MGLSAARDRQPSDAQLRSLEAALAASLGAALTGAGAGAAVRRPTGMNPAPGPAALSAAAFKLTATLVALAATVGGAALYRHRLTADNRRDPTRITAQISDVPVPGAPAPVGEASAPPPFAEVSPAGHEASIEVSRPRRRATAADQLALIARAQRTLASAPASALSLVEENRRALAQSAFAQEAEVIAVAALVRLGRRDEARDRASHFLDRFPDSVHAARMRRIASIIN